MTKNTWSNYLKRFHYHNVSSKALGGGFTNCSFPCCLLFGVDRESRYIQYKLIQVSSKQNKGKKSCQESEGKKCGGFSEADTHVLQRSYLRGFPAGQHLAVALCSQ